MRSSDYKAILQGAQAWTSYTHAQREKKPDWAADLRGADLTRADLRGADLTRADLRHADLTDADLTDADLTDARTTPQAHKNVFADIAESDTTAVSAGWGWSASDAAVAAAAPATTRAPQQRTLIFRTDLGANQSLDRITGCLCDLQIVVRTAERWGLRLSPSATGGHIELATSYSVATADEVQALYRARLEAGAAERDLNSGLGKPSVTVTSVSYRNPMEVWLMAAGPTFLALRSILALIRDWSNTRNKGAAEAERAQAEADLYRHLVDEVKAGRLPADPQHLLNAISDKDLLAMQRLSENPVTLELPENPESEDDGDDAP